VSPLPAQGNLPASPTDLQRLVRVSDEAPTRPNSCDILASVRTDVSLTFFHMGWKKVPITVLVADDSALIRQAICRTLEDDSDIQVVGETKDFASTVLRANELKPQIIVLDLHMPDDDTLAPIAFRSELPNDSRIIAISFSDDEETKNRAREIEASVLLEKMSLATELIPTIKKIVNGN
jgi:two-component system response regulator DegU